LFELDQDNKERDRVLSKMIDWMKKEKSFPTDLEKMAFVALDGANLIDERALTIAWSTSQKLKWHQDFN